MELFRYDEPVKAEAKARRPFESTEVGLSFEAPAPVTLSEAQITAFAEQFDPQPQHIDATTNHPLFTPPVASGAHTFAICHRMAVDACFEELGFIGGVGVDQLRWYSPFEAGMTIETVVEVTDRRRSASRDDRGYLCIEVTGQTLDKSPETVIRYIATGIVETDTA